VVAACAATAPAQGALSGTLRIDWLRPSGDRPASGYVPEVVLDPVRPGETLRRSFPGVREGRALWRPRLPMGAYRIRVRWRVSCGTGCLRPATRGCAARLRVDPQLTLRVRLRARFADGRCTLRTTSPLDRYVGMTLRRAARHARGTGRTVRVVVRDGASVPVTKDLRTDRVNVAVRGRRIVRVDGVY